MVKQTVTLSTHETDFTDILVDCSAGDENARRFLESFVAWVHVVDDLVDRDREVSAETLVAVFLRFVAEIADNPFFQAHKSLLLPAIYFGALGYVESERLARSEQLLERLAAQVLKSQYSQVVFLCAFLVKGWEYMRQMCVKHHQFSFDLSPEDAARLVSPAGEPVKVKNHEQGAVGEAQ